MYLLASDVRQILQIIDGHFAAATVYMEIMSPAVVGRVKEKSIEASGAKFTWGAKSGANLCELVPAFRFVEDRSLVETMREMYPVYKLLGKIGPIRNLSNKIAVIEKRMEKNGFRVVDSRQNSRMIYTVTEKKEA